MTAEKRKIGFLQWSDTGQINHTPGQAALHPGVADYHKTHSMGSLVFIPFGGGGGYFVLLCFGFDVGSGESQMRWKRGKSMTNILYKTFKTIGSKS